MTKKKLDMEFTGAKVALFLGEALLVIQRDDKPGIPFPNHWDFPGGGRESGETPIACVLRETAEEVGLYLQADDLFWSRQYDQSWFFVARRPPGDVGLIRFGDEGQGWQLMRPRDFLTNPLAIPHFRHRLQDYLFEENKL